MTVKTRQLFHGFESGDLRLFQMGIALGRVKGWEIFRKFGMNSDVPATGSEEIWPPGTARVLPTAAGTLSVVSTSTADDDGLTGSWTIVVQGLDAGYNEIQEVITMDGTTPVVGSLEFFRVNRAFGITAGSTNWNVGDISISIGGNLQAFIEATEGQTHQTQYTVPANKTFILAALRMGVGRMAGASDLHIVSEIMAYRSDGQSHWRSVSDIYLWDGATNEGNTGMTLIPPKTEVRQRVISTSATQVFSVATGFLVENRYLSTVAS